MLAQPYHPDLVGSSSARRPGSFPAAKPRPNWLLTRPSQRIGRADRKNTSWRSPALSLRP